MKEGSPAGFVGRRIHVRIAKTEFLNQENPIMLFVGIDQHKRHLTIFVRDEQGEIALRRQVSTKWEEVDRFLASVQERAAAHGGYLAVMEVCGFNGWLIKRLTSSGCERVCVISAPDRIRQKTDRRDAARLSELLWINRDRIAAEQKLVHISEIYQPTEPEQYDRQLTHVRYRLGRSLTRAKNSIKGILRRHNLEQECPTKGGFTKAALQWLKLVELPELDRIELDMRLAEYHLYAKQRPPHAGFFAKTNPENGARLSQQHCPVTRVGETVGVDGRMVTV